MSEYLLSLCIPTYNRSKELDVSLNAIIESIKDKTSIVEIVISDNCSMDNTECVVKKYQRYNKNIKYYRNKENIFDRNFPLVLSKATGKYLKLVNDSFVYNKEAIDYMLSNIKNNIDENNQIIFYNSSDNNTLNCNLNILMQQISYNITDIQNFGIWKNDFIYDEIGCDKSLFQVYKFLDVNRGKKNTILVSNNYGYRQNNKTKDLSYGLFNVFYNNYLSIFMECANEKRISNECLYFLKKDLLLNFFSIWVANTKVNAGNYILSGDENIEYLINKEYKGEKYYYNYLLKKNYYAFKNRIKSIYGKHK